MFACILFCPIRILSPYVSAQSLSIYCVLLRDGEGLPSRQPQHQPATQFRYIVKLSVECYDEDIHIYTGEEQPHLCFYDVIGIKEASFPQQEERRSRMSDEDENISFIIHQLM